MSTIVWIILLGALATYLTRVGGHIVLSRFKTIHPRVQAGLDAVPAAVLTTIIVPPVYDGGPAEWGALLIAGVVGWSRGLIAMVLAGGASVIAFRYLLGA